MNVRNSDGTPLLSVLVSRSDVPKSTIEAILAREDLFLNSQDGRGWSALHYAANDDVLFALLLSAGVDPRLKTVDGEIAAELKVEKRSILGKVRLAKKRRVSCCSQKGGKKLFRRVSVKDSPSKQKIEMSESEIIEDPVVNVVSVPKDQSLKNFSDKIEKGVQLLC